MLLRRVAGAIAGGLLLMLSGLGPARAVPMMFQDDVAMFGNLAQGKTKCPKVNCGPTAAINSFVFLQNRWPNVYGNKLFGNVGRPPTMVELINSANNLACHFTMNCKRGRVSGTLVGDFILGKQDFIDSVAPNSTVFAAQISQPWNNLIDPFHMAAKPNYVRANTKPTAAFLFNQLRMGEDVEIGVMGPFTTHYLTVTGIDYNPMTGTGTLSVIDPTTGKPTKKPLMLAFQRRGPLAGALLTNYAGSSVILDAVAESPKNRGKTNMPEPGGLVLLATGLAGIAAVRSPSLGRSARRVGPLRGPPQ